MFAIDGIEFLFTEYFYTSKAITRHAGNFHEFMQAFCSVPQQLQIQYPYQRKD